VDWFRVRSLRVQGVRFLAADEVERAAAVPAGANLWDDVGPVAARLRAHPLVRDVRIARRLPGTLVVRVEERQPVGLLPTPTLEPVDFEGRRLPLDPALHRLDLPVIRAARPGRGSAAPAAIAAAAREAARLAQVDPVFWEGISVLTEQGARDLTIEWGDPAVRLRFRAPLAQARLREAKAVLADIAGRGDPTPLLLDLRFADQVVVRWTETDRGAE
jgi:cell division protein FtsQ